MKADLNILYTKGNERRALNKEIDQNCVPILGKTFQCWDKVIKAIVVNRMILKLKPNDFSLNEEFLPEFPGYNEKKNLKKHYLTLHSKYPNMNNLSL